MMKVLSGIANNVNQLARKAHEYGSVNSQALKIEAEKWSHFQTEIRETFLLPEKK